MAASWCVVWLFQVNLTTLDLAGNRIKRIENVKHLTKIEEFWVSYVIDS